MRALIPGVASYLSSIVTKVKSFRSLGGGARLSSAFG
jgi:hypothetical protein